MISNTSLNSYVDSVETSLTLKLFSTRQLAELYHQSHTMEYMMQMSDVSNIHNFDSNRLQSTIEEAYPLENRPRGPADLTSVRFHMQEIERQRVEPIWIVCKKEYISILNQIYERDVYYLTDGAHRIVAHHLCNKNEIPCRVVYF